MMNRNTLKWITFCAAGAMAVAFSIPAVDFLITRGDKEYVQYDASQPEIVAAEHAARNSLEHFREELSKATSTDGFTLYVRLFTSRGSYEVVSLAEVDFIDDGTVKGRINHQPFNTLRGGLKQGDQVTVSMRDVTDWSYWDGPKMRGNFSARVFLKLQNDENREAMLSDLHESPLP